MRVVTAWFLIFISTSHLLGGHLWFEVNYWMEVQRQMDKTEHLIAEALKEDGIISRVKVVAGNEVVQRGNFYSGDFVFSTKIDSSLVYYTIEYAPKTITVEKIASDQPEPTNSNDKAAFLKSLLKEFMVPEFSLAAHTMAERSNIIFSVELLSFSSFLPVPSPPPDVA